MPSKLRVLVLGANGFIGRAILRYFSQDPRIQLLAGVRQGGKGLGEIEEVMLDANDLTAVEAACRRVDAIIFSLAGKEAGMQRAISNVCAATRSAVNRPLLIFLSSIAVYGPAYRLVNETSTLDPSVGGYGQLKIRSEELVRDLPRWLILRPGIVYGPGSELWSTQIGRLVAAGKIDLAREEMTATCNAVYVDDLARCIHELLFTDGAENNVFNVVGADALDWNDFFRLHAISLNVSWPASSKPPMKRKLARLVDSLAFTKYKALRALGIGGAAPPPILRPWLTDQCRQGPSVDSSAVRKLLSMSWTAVDVGVAQSVLRSSG